MAQNGLLQAAAQIVMTTSILFLLLLGFSFHFGEPGTAGYVVAQVTVIPVVIMFIASLVIIRTGWEPF